jgi:hypothetical protein
LSDRGPLARLRQRLGFPKPLRKNDCVPERRPGGATGINRFERRYYSQNGEDGILAEIFRRIGGGSKFFVEFGVEDGLECNTAYLARRLGWSGVMMEADERRFAELRKNYRRFPKVRTVQAMVTSENASRSFSDAAIPREFDLLSIDIDGNDYWVWKALLAEYHPRVCVVEFNANYPPPALWVIKYDSSFRWDDTTYFGASLSSMVALGDANGYAFVGADCNLVNAFFVRCDVLANGLEEVRPEDVYHYPPSFPRHPYRAGPSLAV